jgi:hypothetical protein
MHFYPHFPLLTRSNSPNSKENSKNSNKKGKKTCLIFIKSCSDSYKKLKKFNIIDSSLSYIHKIKEASHSTKTSAKTPKIERKEEMSNISFLPPIKSDDMIQKLVPDNFIRIGDVTSGRPALPSKKSDFLKTIQKKSRQTSRNAKNFVSVQRTKKVGDIKNRSWKTIKVKKISSNQAVQVDIDDISGW